MFDLLTLIKFDVARAFFGLAVAEKHINIHHSNTHTKTSPNLGDGNNL